MFDDLVFGMYACSNVPIIHIIQKTYRWTALLHNSKHEPPEIKLPVHCRPVLDLDLYTMNQLQIRQDVTLFDSCIWLPWFLPESKM